MTDTEASGETLAVEVAEGRRRSFDTRKAFMAALILVLLALPWLGFRTSTFNYWIQLLLIALMWIAMASSWNIIGGYAGYVSLGHNFFFGVGAYLSGVLLAYLGLSPFLTAPFAGLLAMVAGLLFGLISLRTRGPAFIISTIALVLVVTITVDNWDFVGGANGLSLPFFDPLSIPWLDRVLQSLNILPLEFIKFPFYYGMLLIAIGAVYTSYRIRHSKFGLGLRAISQDETKAEVAGIRTRLYKILAFGISGIFVGMAGALWAYQSTYLHPDTFLQIRVAARMVLMTILGGKGTVAGPIVGAVVLIAADEFFVASLGSSELNIVAVGGFMLLVLLFFPEGIVGTLKEHGLLPRFLDWD